MRTPSSRGLLAFLLLLIISALLLMLRWRERQTQPEPVVVAEANVLGAKNGLPARNRRPRQTDDLAQHPAVILVANSMNVDPVQLAQRAVKTKTIVEDKNVDVRFYGKVVDQNDQPLGGVLIKAHSRRWQVKDMFLPEGKMHYDTQTTGPDGLFSFVNFHGDTFYADSITKDGYILKARSVLGYSYGPLAHHFVPNPLVPVVFRMWKTNGATPLYVVELQGGIPQDGTVLEFDLRRNKRVRLPVHDTDIRITLKQSAPPGQRNSNVPFDWEFTMEVPDGGLVETQDEFMYLAPEQGYESKWSASYPKNHPAWKVRREVNFYLRNRGGQQYGRLKVDFSPDPGDATGYIAIAGYLNPSGRVLEYDVNKKLYPAPEVPLGPGYTPPGQPVRPTGPSFTPGSVAPQGIPALPPGMPPPPGFQALTNRAGPFVPPPPPRPR